jgi:hypothetical protein
VRVRCTCQRSHCQPEPKHSQVSAEPWFFTGVTTLGMLRLSHSETLADVCCERRDEPRLSSKIVSFACVVDLRTRILDDDAAIPARQSQINLRAYATRDKCFQQNSNSPRHHPHRCQQYLTGGIGKHSLAAPRENVFSGHATHLVELVAVLRLL